MPHHHCYLLRSKTETERSYIGCSDDYERRLKQHNGLLGGGADETEFGRPWEFVVIVHGFPDKETALQFEKAWQTTQSSKYVRDAIGNAEADLLARQTDLQGTLSGRLAAMKCLLNHCEDFTECSLHLEFSTEEWTQEFLQAKYILTETNDGSVVPDESAPTYSIVPHKVNKDLLTLSSEAVKSMSDFRWKMIDKDLIHKVRSKQLSPELWKKVQNLASAMRRADERHFFQDERGEHILLGEEYRTLEEIARHAKFADFTLALRKATSYFKGQSGALEKLQDVASQFGDYGEEFSAHLEGGQAIGDTNVESTVYQFIEEKRRAMERKYPVDCERIANLFEKVLGTRRVLTRPSISHKSPRTSIGRARTEFTTDQKAAIEEGVAKYGMDVEKIRASYRELAGLTLEQIKNRIKNTEKKKRSAEDSSDHETETGHAPKKRRKERQDFSQDEDQAILNGFKMYEMEGFKWRCIKEDEVFGPILKERTAETIRKRYDKVLKRKVLRNEIGCIQVVY